MAKKKGKTKAKGKGKKDDIDEDNLLIKFYEIKKLRTAYLRQCKHFVTVPQEQVLKRIEKYHNLDYLSSNNDYLDKIIIESSQMTCNDMYALSTSFQNFKYLKTLCLWNVQMDKGAFIAMDKFLSRHKFIEYFQCFYCNANVENSIYLASILRNTEALVDITFDHNPLHGDGILNIFRGIKENPSTKIRRISLRHCEATGEFCEALIPILGQNKTILEIDLTGNSIGQDGVMFIATALMNNNTLKVLNLSSNNITDDQELYGRSLLTPVHSKSNLSAAPAATNAATTAPVTAAPTVIENENENATAPNPVGAGGLVSDVSNAVPGGGTDAASTDAGGGAIASSIASGMEGKSKTASNSNMADNTIGDEISTSTLSYLADAVSREESAITHLDLSGNNIGNNGGEIMLEALKNRKALVIAKKKTAPIFICNVTERMKSDIFTKIFDINKYMLEQEKKRGGKKKGKKGKKGKK